jgi:hypothetical protein
LFIIDQVEPWIIYLAKDNLDNNNLKEWVVTLAWPALQASASAALLKVNSVAYTELFNG